MYQDNLETFQTLKLLKNKHKTQNIKHKTRNSK